jgi:hypothetical protein
MTTPRQHLDISAPSAPDRSVVVYSPTSQRLLCVSSALSASLRGKDRPA